MRPVDLTIRYLLTSASYVPGKPARAKRDDEPALGDLNALEATIFALILGAALGASAAVTILLSAHSGSQVALRMDPVTNLWTALFAASGYVAALARWTMLRGADRCEREVAPIPVRVRN